MERAVSEGADVVNMSLGSERSWTNTLHALAAAALAGLGGRHRGVNRELRHDWYLRRGRTGHRRGRDWRRELRERSNYPSCLRPVAGRHASRVRRQRRPCASYRRDVIRSPAREPRPAQQMRVSPSRRAAFGMGGARAARNLRILQQGAERRTGGRRRGRALQQRRGSIDPETPRRQRHPTRPSPSPW